MELENWRAAPGRRKLEWSLLHLVCVLAEPAAKHWPVGCGALTAKVASLAEAFTEMHQQRQTYAMPDTLPSAIESRVGEILGLCYLLEHPKGERAYRLVSLESPSECKSQGLSLRLVARMFDKFAPPDNAPDIEWARRFLDGKELPPPPKRIPMPLEFDDPPQDIDTPLLTFVARRLAGVNTWGTQELASLARHLAGLGVEPYERALAEANRGAVPAGSDGAVLDSDDDAGEMPEEE